MANALYTSAKTKFLTAAINWTSDTIQAVLVKSAYTPSLTSHAFLSDLGSNVIGSPVTLTSCTVTAGVANAANPTFASVATGNTVRYVAILKSTGTASTSPLILLVDTATNIPATTEGNDITVSWDTGANKIFALT